MRLRHFLSPSHSHSASSLATQAYTTHSPYPPSLSLRDVTSSPAQRKWCPTVCTQAVDMHTGWPCTGVSSLFLSHAGAGPLPRAGAVATSLFLGRVQSGSPILPMTSSVSRWIPLATPLVLSLAISLIPGPPVQALPACPLPGIPTQGLAQRTQKKHSLGPLDCMKSQRSRLIYRLEPPVHLHRWHHFDNTPLEEIRSGMGKIRGLAILSGHTNSRGIRWH